MVVYVIFACGMLALVAAAIYARRVMASSGVEAETPEVQARFKDISGAIGEGAMAFLSREYSYVGSSPASSRC